MKAWIRRGAEIGAPWLLLALAALPGRLVAQAWLPPQGDVFFAMSYQNAYYRNHADDAGNPDQLGRVRGQSVLFDAGYGVLEKFALSANVAYLKSKWDVEPNPTPKQALPHGPNDDGHYHGEWQDLRIQLRYALLSEPVVVTPTVGLLVPTHDYEVRGHTAVGHGFVEAPVGFFVGKLLDPLLPGTYVQGRYAYSFVEGFQGLNLDHSDFAFELGYAVSSRINTRTFADFHRGHGGLQINDTLPPQSNPLFFYHDRSIRSAYDRVGASVAFAYSDAVEVFVAGFYTTGAKDSSLTNAFSVGFSYSFSSVPSRFRCKCS